MRRVLAGLSVGAFLVVAACVGDDASTSSSSSSSSSSGNVPDGGGPGGSCSPASCSGTCVDGVCCDKPCTGTCEACNVPGHEGTCTPVMGKPVHGDCKGDPAGACAGTCDGKSTTECSYPEVACGAKTCAGGQANVARCKAGTCGAPEQVKCALGCLEDGCLGVKQVAGGYYHTCAALTDGRVRCWGANESGQTGQEPALGNVVMKPIEVPGISDAVMIGATFSTSCALLKDGTVKCWGSNVSGNLGRGGGAAGGDNTPHAQPMPVLGVSGATFLTGGSAGTFCAIVAGGKIMCWGGNSSGILGRNSTSPSYDATPAAVCAVDGGAACSPSAGATFVATGDSHACAVFAGGKVACWGHNVNGEAGQPPSANPVLTPTTVAGLTATWLSLGNQVSCAASDGAAKCWGLNSGQGRLGIGESGADKTSTPTKVCTKADCSTTLMDVKQVTTFDESSCALASGAVTCWGSNTNGQLGDGNMATQQKYAATKAVAQNAVAVASGGGCNFAIVDDGINRDVRCWGSEGSSQCGAGPTAARPTPVAPTW